MVPYKYTGTRGYWRNTLKKALGQGSKLPFLAMCGVSNRSRHRSNNFNHVSGDKLVANLKGYRAKPSAIVYCQRIGTEEIFEKLKNSVILTISLANH